MSVVIDRRLNSKKKSTVNRQRFLRRYRNIIQEAVQEAVDNRSITDIDSGSDIHIPKKDISEPFFHHGKGGVYKQIHPGNKIFSQGDRIQRSPSGGHKDSADKHANKDGNSSDDFVFQINRDEFLEFLFNDLELPNLISKDLRSSTEFKVKQTGFTFAGSPDRLNVVRSLRAAYARRIALTGNDRRLLRHLKNELQEIEVYPRISNQQRANIIREEVKTLNYRIKKRPFIDTFDLRYNNIVKHPKPLTKAVIFCILDVSGSMTREIKDIAKRFFLLLYMFLKRNYENLEVVFIRHHTKAQECTEHDFFYARETGGTVVSSALSLTDQLIQKRYPPSGWNIYVAQASDGDNWDEDVNKCTDIINKKILPLTQYYSYIEITDDRHQSLWHEYKTIEKKNPSHFAMQKIRNHSDIYPVFRRLFEKKEVQNAHKT